jgi:hypothetical protein
MLSSKAMSNRFRVSSTLPQKLKELGLSPDIVLRRADLPIGLFKLDRILVSTEQFFALHRGIAEASNDPAIGLKLGTEERVERYDPVKLAALVRARSGTRWSGRHATNNSRVQKKSVWSNGAMNAQSSSSGFSGMSKNLHCW